MPTPHSSLAEVVEDPALARLVDELRDALSRMHGEVRLTESPLELQVEFRGVLLCRLVPYPALLHIQVGQHPTWEARVRTPGEFPPVMNQIVRALLRVVARG